MVILSTLSSVPSMVVAVAITEVGLVLIGQKEGTSGEIGRDDGRC